MLFPDSRLGVESVPDGDGGGRGGEGRSIWTS